MRQRKREGETMRQREEGERHMIFAACIISTIACVQTKGIITYPESFSFPRLFTQNLDLFEGD